MEGYLNSEGSVLPGLHWKAGQVTRISSSTIIYKPAAAAGGCTTGITVREVPSSVALQQWPDEVAKRLRSPKCVLLYMLFYYLTLVVSLWSKAGPED